MSMSALTERYRPKTYADVVGQDLAVKILRIAGARGGEASVFRGRSVLLAGADGTGKTSLAEIYARALLCTGPPGAQGAGEACGACRDCDRVARGDHPNYVRLYEDQIHSASALDVVHSAVGSHAWAGGWMVVLIDGADRISANLWDALHRRVERAPTGVTFIITARSFEALPRRSREALLCIETRELAIIDRVELLRRVAVAEGIEFDAAALDGLARLGGGRPRALLNHLESLWLKGPVTAAAVRAHFRVPQTKRALEYLECVLARASLTKQLEALRDGGRFEPGDAADTIRGVLVSILGAPVLGLPNESLPFAFEEARGRGDLGIALLERRTALGLNLREMFSRLVAWWSVPVDDEAGLIARLNDFDEWLNGPGALNEDVSDMGPQRIARRRQPSALRRLVRGSAPSVRPRPGHEGSATFLSAADVQRVWDAASFLIQKHGLYLRARLSLCWGFGEQDDTAEISAAINGFQHELRLWVRRREKGRTKTEAGKFHWIRVHARDEGGARWTHWGMAVSPKLDVNGWISKYQRRRTDPLLKMTRFEWDPGSIEGGVPLRRHHDVLAHLLSGMDPQWRESVMNELEQPSERAVSDLLGVRALQSAGERFLTPRTGVSRYLDWDYRAQAGDILPMLSLFDERAWGCALTGWEVDEFAYRRQCEMEHAGRLAQIEVEWPAKDDRMAERRAAELQAFEEAWAKGGAGRDAGRPGFKTKD